MKYLTLFTLEIEHSFYADSRCPDFRIDPAPATQKTLNDYRCILKSSPSSLRVMVPVDDQGLPFLSIPEKLLFSFSLTLLNPNFGLFTDLGDFSQQPAPLYTNLQALTAPDLALTSRSASSSETLAVQNPGKLEPFTLGGKPLDSLSASDFAIDGLGKVTSPASFDPSSRVLQVNSAKASPGTLFTVSYAVMPRLGRGAFAEVDIFSPAVQANLAGNAIAYRIAFKAKEARWKYYLVTDKVDNKAIVPTLQDSQNLIVFNPADRTDLNQAPDAADQVALRLVQQYPNKQYFRFISSNLIACQEVPRKNIQLLLDGQKVVDGLSNPALLNYSIDTQNSTQETALHQIVEYFTR